MNSGKLMDTGRTEAMQSTGRKLKVLLIWFELPNRPELLKYFVDLSDEIDFVHLWYNSKDERNASESSFPMIYWIDYTSPYAMIDAIKPDKILGEFPGDLKTIALTIAAKNRGIPVLALTHGIYFSNTYDITIDKPSYPMKGKSIAKYLKISRFYWSIFNFKNLRLIPRLVYYYVLFLLKGSWKATAMVRFKERNPLCYIVYQAKNVYEQMRRQHLIERDEVVPIGVLNFDGMLQKLPQLVAQSSDAYYLLIDTAWIYQQNKPSQEVVDTIYTRLADFCARDGRMLYVKLHPHWYENPSLPQHPSIRYLRALSEDELTETIANAKGCFCNISTLSIPVIYFKKTYLLYYQTKTEDVRYFEELGVCKLLEIASFRPEDIDFAHFHRDERALAQFVTDYLYSTDGRATERLKALLLA